MTLRFEVCVDSVAGALAAQAAGADRVELCQALSVGGLTPSAALIQTVRAEVDLGLHVLVRPRPGDFAYDEAELDVLRRDLELAAEWGADGVVIGVLRDTGAVDAEATASLVAAARPLSVTFHRAFDVTPDADAALEVLADLGVDRILTSGQAADAHTGRAVLRRLVSAAPQGLTILAGAGITPDNAEAVVRDTGVRELHFSGSRRLPGRAGAGGVSMGADAEADRARVVTDAGRLRATMEAARRALTQARRRPGAR